MEYLFSNYNPLRTENYTFQQKFMQLLEVSDQLDIAVGYVSQASLLELKRILELNPKIKKLNLVIGMHYIEGFTKLQYDAVKILDKYLLEDRRGEVNLVKSFKFHGKLYLYSKDEKPFAGIIGSNNLNSIIDGTDRTYEAAMCLDETKVLNQMQEFINQLTTCACAPLNDTPIDTFKKEKPLFEGQELVKKVPPEEIVELLQEQGPSFNIPIRVTEKSNLNVYFGEGRANTRTGFVKPRHWYEVEIIVPVSIRRLDDYPKNDSNHDGIFTVITDDGWKFRCKVQGGNSTDKNKNKNLRSADSLEILGMWLKGRLENKGVLKVGERVTDEVLQAYGRKYFTMTKLKGDNLWYFDFKAGNQ